MGGAVFEGLIMTEIWKAFLNLGKKPAVFFWRSQGGLEVDAISQAGNRLWPIEIKLTSTPSSRHSERLNLFKEVAGKAASDTGLLVCNTAQQRSLPGNNLALPWRKFPAWIEDRIGS